LSNTVLENIENEEIRPLSHSELDAASGGTAIAVRKTEEPEQGGEWSITRG
jgi:hypothetical protein